MNQEEYDQYLQRMMALCSNSEKCEHDIEQKLKKYNIPDDGIQKILRDLQDNDFINHTRYVEAFVNDKLRFNHWGKRKIAQALRGKNIDEKLIQTKLDEIDAIYYEQILEEELEKKISKLSKPLDRENKAKVLRFLIQKGFEYGKVFDILEKRASKE
ncbi:MAG: regulatory protein RecX [Bacteroidota bacterium]